MLYNVDWSIALFESWYEIRWNFKQLSTYLLHLQIVIPQTGKLGDGRVGAEIISGEWLRFLLRESRVSPFPKDEYLLYRQSVLPTILHMNVLNMQTSWPAMLLDDSSR